MKPIECLRVGYNRRLGSASLRLIFMVIALMMLLTGWWLTGVSGCLVSMSKLVNIRLRPILALVKRFCDVESAPWRHVLIRVNCCFSFYLYFTCNLFLFYDVLWRNNYLLGIYSGNYTQLGHAIILHIRFSYHRDVMRRRMWRQDSKGNSAFCVLIMIIYSAWFYAAPRIRPSSRNSPVVCHFPY